MHRVIRCLSIDCIVYLNVSVISPDPAEDRCEASGEDGRGSQVVSRRRTRTRTSGGEAVLGEHTLLPAVTVSEREREILGMKYYV